MQTSPINALKRLLNLLLLLLSGQASIISGVSLTFADVPPGVLNGGVAVDVGEQAEAESVAVVGGIREAIDKHAGGGRLEGLADAVVKLVVNNGAPVLGFLIGHGLHICTGSTLTGHGGEGSAAQTHTYLTHV